MSLNAHAFVEGDYMGTLYRAAERLSDEDLEKRIGMYEERQAELDEGSNQENLALRFYDWGVKSPWMVPSAALTFGLAIVPFLLVATAGIAYNKLTENKPLILDNVNPLVKPEDAYRAAVEVRDFRRKQD